MTKITIRSTAVIRKEISHAEAAIRNTLEQVAAQQVRLAYLRCELEQAKERKYA